MAKLIVLGSSNAIPTRDHENTHLALVCQDRAVLIDCVGTPFVRLEQARIDPLTITDLILTHFHPDHVSGVPMFLMDSWLIGRHTPLNVHGLAYTLERVKAMMELYSWSDWPDFYPVNFCNVADDEMAPVLDVEDIRVHATPVRHFLPNMGLRIEMKAGGKSVAYSCDTEPCDEMERLAQGVDILLHEASGLFPGHSSAAQAGEVARRGEVGALYLIHYPTGRHASGDLVAEAKTKFPGEVHLARDFMEINLQ